VKTKKLVLDFVQLPKYQWIGICSPHADYRFVWNLNNELGIKLVQANNQFTKFSKKTGDVTFSTFEWKNEQDFSNVRLIKNKNGNHFLIPEKFQIDYWFVILETNRWEIDELIEKIRSINVVMLCSSFDSESMPSTETIILE
jgi:hypothetical protein